MSKRQKVKVRKVYRAFSSLLSELGTGAAYAISH